MGRQQREYIRNVAGSMMGQLGIIDEAVGVDAYYGDVIAAGIRQKTFQRVFDDLRHVSPGTLSRMASCGLVGETPPYDVPEAHDRLHAGETHCTVDHVHWHTRPHWLHGLEKSPPCQVIRHMAASAIVAAMYDIVVARRSAPRSERRPLVDLTVPDE